MKQKLHDNNFILRNSFDSRYFCHERFCILRSPSLPGSRLFIIHVNSHSLDIEIFEKPRGVFAESSRSKARCNSKEKRGIKGVDFSRACHARFFLEFARVSSRRVAKSKSQGEIPTLLWITCQLDSQSLAFLFTYMRHQACTRVTSSFRATELQGAKEETRVFAWQTLPHGRFFTVNPVAPECCRFSSCFELPTSFENQFLLEIKSNLDSLKIVQNKNNNLKRQTKIAKYKKQ